MWAPQLLLERTPLARVVAGYTTACWGVRLLVQFVRFHGAAPTGLGYVLADRAVTAGTVTYGSIACDTW